jgi:GTPase SAR1 family protein
MADQQQPAKKPKGFVDRLKKVFRPGSQSTPPSGSNFSLTVAEAPPTVTVPPTIITDPEEAAKLRARYTHFRVLVIGRANAGKTTLLKRVCNTKEDPVYSKVKHRLRLNHTLIVPSPTD